MVGVPTMKIRSTSSPSRSRNKHWLGIITAVQTFRLSKLSYFENSVSARMSGTPSEIASNDRLAAHPYWVLPDA